MYSGRYFWNTATSGDYDKLDYQGTYGFWWTSTPANNTTGAYAMGIAPYGTETPRGDGRSAGFPLRCYIGEKNYYAFRHWCVLDRENCPLGVNDLRD